ncbi:MAG: hypothetical protein HQK51_20985, partial [Oligoflexia bacterium]|nr:hypothetical protein [Oligoflexia bacterium]
SLVGYRVDEMLLAHQDMDIVIIKGKCDQNDRRMYLMVNYKGEILRQQETPVSQTIILHPINNYKH